MQTKKSSRFWILALAILLPVFSITLKAQTREKDITGNWQGTLQDGSANGLRTLVRIYKDDGKLKAVMYSIDQGGGPIPITTISIQGTTVTFNIKQRDTTYTGTLESDGKTIIGSATLAGKVHDLNLAQIVSD